ncbi:MAG: MerR family transcriptional regulator [Eubacteriales bacterium]|nr:MerR family transcriptional regulator [Eubacteriales bacterium]
MLRIGEFASLTGISIHMLRNYDKIGLLSPARIELSNGYRFYEAAQILQARQIQILKDLGFGLSDISAMLRCSDEERKTKIQTKITERKRERANIDRQIHQMELAAEQLGHFGDIVFSIRIARLPAHRAISLRRSIGSFEEEGMLWGELDRECTRLGILNTDQLDSYAITHGIDLENKRFDTEVQRTIPVSTTGSTALKYADVPAMEVAAATIKGAYRRISDISGYVYMYLENTEYEIGGAPIRRYVLSPKDGCPERDYITEYLFPLKKRQKTA